MTFGSLIAQRGSAHNGLDFWSNLTLKVYIYKYRYLSHETSSRTQVSISSLDCEVPKITGYYMMVVISSECCEHVSYDNYSNSKKSGSKEPCNQDTPFVAVNK